MSEPLRIFLLTSVNDEYMLRAIRDFRELRNKLTFGLA